MVRVKELVTKFFAFVIYSITFVGLILFLFSMTSTLFFTAKNWNNVKKGVITDTWVHTQFGKPYYHPKMYAVKVEGFVFESQKGKIQTNFKIGDSVLVQYKGNEIVKILSVNGQKVARKMGIAEYFSIILIPLLSLIIALFIRRTKKHKTYIKYFGNKRQS